MAGNNGLVLLAGGSGRRMGNAIHDKLLTPLAGRPAIARCLDAFAASGAVQSAAVVYRDPEQKGALQEAIGPSSLALVWTPGGAERQYSVWEGLKALPPDLDVVLIHDGARPLVAPAAIRRAAEAALASGAACVAKRVTDTIKQAPAQAATQFAPRTLDRSRLWATETPQAFRFGLIRDAYEKLIHSGKTVTDDLTAIEDSGLSVVFLENGAPNVKLTTPQDIAYATFLLRQPDALSGL